MVSAKIVRAVRTCHIGALSASIPFICHPYPDGRVLVRTDLRLGLNRGNTGLALRVVRGDAVGLLLGQGRLERREPLVDACQARKDGARLDLLAERLGVLLALTDALPRGEGGQAGGLDVLGKGK